MTIALIKSKLLLMKKIIKLFSVIWLVTLIIVGCSRTEEDKAQKVAKEFVTELYTVDAKEIVNYNNLLSMEIKDVKQLSEALQMNNKTLKTLMTEKAYQILLLNRKKLMFSKYCEKGNYTMQVAELTLSEKTFNKEENKAEYDIEVKLNFISNNDNLKQMDIGQCNIRLLKENGQWKVFGYREIKLPKTIIDTSFE